ncbi:MAG: RES domain-containing protein, partial [Sphingobacteriia bacterium]|nr:RES domain-containing protein [Sphingobacteriia bacterium]
THQYRIVSSEFPPINLFETLVEPDLMEELFYLEGLTNERLRDEAGDIALVDREDRVCGPGSTPVMAAFTHIGVVSRFSDGRFGVYYAAKTLHTAIEETKYHRARFLAYTREDAGEIGMRVYVGAVAKPLHDIRGANYDHLHDPDDWRPSQAFGVAMRAVRSWGIVYRSVRDPGGECIAALRPPAVTIPRQGPHLSYVWDGTGIVRVYRKTLIQSS